MADKPCLGLEIWHERARQKQIGKPRPVLIIRRSGQSMFGDKANPGGVNELFGSRPLLFKRLPDKAEAARG